MAGFSAMGGLGGVASLAALLVWGGELKSRVTTNERDLMDLREKGPPPFRSFAEQQKVTNQDTLRRLDNLELMDRMVNEISSKLSVLDNKMDNIGERLKKLEK